MTTLTSLHDRYRTDAVATMSPARLVVALYDRLVLDLNRAIAAVGANDVTAAHATLVHAQDVVSELHDALDVTAWAPAQALADLYRFVHSELVAANLTKDVARMQNALRVVEPLRDTWREAATLATSAPPAPVA